MKTADWIKELFMALLKGALQTWPTSLTLIAANLVPVVGLLWFDWPPRTILFLFWAETMIIGGWTLPKLVLVSGWRALFYVPAMVFVLAGPGLFVTLLIMSLADPAAYPDMEFYSRSLLQEKRWAIAAFAISHGLSFAYHFIWRGESRRHTARRVVVDFASRVGMLLVGFGAANLLFSAFYGPASWLLGVVAAKTLLDLWLHLKEHEMLQPETAKDIVPARAELKNPAAAFALGLFFGPMGMLYSTIRGAIAMFFLIIPSGFLGYAFVIAITVWTGMAESEAGPGMFANVLFLVIIWLFAVLPCGYWAWRAARAHNRRIETGQNDPPPAPARQAQP